MLYSKPYIHSIQLVIPLQPNSNCLVSYYLPDGSLVFCFLVDNTILGMNIAYIK